jgi:hypothetical protein
VCHICLLARALPPRSFHQSSEILLRNDPAMMSAASLFVNPRFPP